MITQALLNLSTPGFYHDGFMKKLASVFEKHGIETKKVDTVLGWGNLNQHWLELTCEIETSWDWCKPTVLNDEEWNWFHSALSCGMYIMMVYYKDKDGNLHPHG